MAKPLVRPSPWEHWPKWREQFHAILDPALYTLAWLDGEVACGRMILFASANSAILCSIKVYPTGYREIQGEAATGKLFDIVEHLIPSAENWARAIGCQSAQIQSREGWVRQMKKRGYSHYQTTIRKAL